LRYVKVHVSLLEEVQDHDDGGHGYRRYPERDRLKRSQDRSKPFWVGE